MTNRTYWHDERKQVLEQALTKQQIIKAFDNAYEHLLAVATTCHEREGSKNLNGEWGSRQVLTHIAGWAAQATAFIPQAIAGIPPQTYYDETQHAAIDDAFNAAYIALIGHQTFEQALTLVHQTHKDFANLLQTLDESVFVSGSYAYDRLQGVILHHIDHAQALDASR